MCKKTFEKIMNDLLQILSPFIDSIEEKDFTTFLRPLFMLGELFKFMEGSKK